MDKNILQKSLKYFRCSKGHNSKSRLYRQSIWTVEMINGLWISPSRKSVRARQDLHSVDWAVFNSSSNQNYVGTSMIYNVLTMNHTTKRTIVQCTCDQQTLGSVCASTHYIKQTSWIARSPKKVHTVRSAKDLIRMWCYSHTVYPPLDSPAIEGKYDQRMFWLECAVAQIDPSLRSSHKMFC